MSFEDMDLRKTGFAGIYSAPSSFVEGRHDADGEDTDDMTDEYQDRLYGRQHRRWTPKHMD